MPDIVDSTTRSRMMSGIRGKNTKPELQVRKALFAEGFRFRIHASDLPGRPDVVLPRYRAAIFVHGCFWHGHDCSLFKLPSTRRDFWSAKIEANRVRDTRAFAALREAGWRTLVVWECALRGKTAALPALTERCSRWIKHGNRHSEFRSARAPAAKPPRASSRIQAKGGIPSEPIRV